MAATHNRSTHKLRLPRKGHHPHFTGRFTTDREMVCEVSSDFLDDVYRRLSDIQCSQQEFEGTLDRFFLALRAHKLNSSEEQWQEFIGACRSHPIKDLLHQDPFTFHAFRRPRNYPGDAALLDMIYGWEERWPIPEASPLGRRLFDYNILAPGPEGVRARRGLVADWLDQLAAEISMPHVLSVASGHLREAGLSAAVKRRKIGRFLALDSDAVSLEEVKRCYSGFGVETVHAGIRRLLTSQAKLGNFDFVYSTGLFDYLGQRVSRRLVYSMFQMLRPGGRLMAANFLPGVRDVGYMETFMDWRLIYRTRQEMIDMTMEIPEDEVRDITIFAEENRNIIFLRVTKN